MTQAIVYAWHSPKIKIKAKTKTNTNQTSASLVLYWNGLEAILLTGGSELLLRAPSLIGSQSRLVFHRDTSWALLCMATIESTNASYLLQLDLDHLHHGAFTGPCHSMCPSAKLCTSQEENYLQSASGMCLFYI